MRQQNGQPIIVKGDTPAQTIRASLAVDATVKAVQPAADVQSRPQS